MFGKSCNLQVELEHLAMWAIYKFNFDMATIGSNRKLQLNELEALRNDAYERVQRFTKRGQKLFTTNKFVVSLLSHTKKCGYSI